MQLFEIQLLQVSKNKIFSVFGKKYEFETFVRHEKDGISIGDRKYR